MKFKFIKDNNEEKVVVYAQEKNNLVNQIEELVISNDLIIDGVNINGYLESDIVPIKIFDIVSFYCDDDKTFARVGNKSYQIKFRLYQIEEKLSNSFIRINKSRIINKNFIEKFDISWNGTIMVKMKNGDFDYVSRRLLKTVKERMELR